MKAKNILYLMLVAGISLTQRAYAQPGVNLQIYQSINTEVKQIFGPSYSAGSLINVDSSLTPNEIEDPYGTLKHCFVFFGGNDDWSFIGIYRDGQIIWHSDTVIAGDNVSGVNFYAIKDINRDGKVDIITSWDVGDRFGEEYLWIFGWDGDTGFLENAYDNQNQSVIAAEQGGFTLEDVNGDGIMEIIGEQDSVQFVYETDNGVTQKVMNIIEKRYNVYSWNGQLYGEWSDTPLYPVNGIVPRNRVDVAVHASVIETVTGLDYRYIIHSKQTSQQDIDQIVLVPVSDSLQGISARPGWGFNPGDGNLLWQGGDFLNPGGTDSNFVYRTEALPAICSYYIRGHNGDPMGPGGQAWYNDVLTNSAHGLTIGAADLPSPFVPLAFLDTLISYKHRCVTLGWVRDDKSREQECEEMMKGGNWYRKEEVGKMRSWEVDESWDFDGDWSNGIVGVLDKRLEKAKQALTRGDSVGARRDLQIFVMEVELVNRLGERQEGREVRSQRPVMTSEAYALLKYNAEYLIGRLPERHGRGDERRGKK